MKIVQGHGYPCLEVTWDINTEKEREGEIDRDRERDVFICISNNKIIYII